MSLSAPKTAPMLTGEDEFGTATALSTKGVQLRDPVVTVEPNDPGTWRKSAGTRRGLAGSAKKFKHCHGALV
jgi:hypothetical protein